MPETDLYEKDCYAWANETADAIRSGEFSRIDTVTLADEVADTALLDDSPSLRPWLLENLASIYEVAVQLAVRDTNLPKDSFPPNCPYTLDEILSLKPVDL